MKYKSDIQSVIFLGEYPSAERYSLLKRHKIVPISKCTTEGTNKSYCIIESNKFTSLRTYKIKSYCNDNHVRYVNLIIGEY